MNMLPSIPPLDMRSDIGNIGERWAKWIQRLENYLVATNIVDENRKTAILLHLIGEDAYDTYMSLPEIPESDPSLTSPFEIAKQKLKAYFEPKVNIDFETFRFWDAKQMSDETIDQYYTRLLKLSESCKFTNADNEIKGQIILNTCNKELRKYGLTEQPDLTKLLNKARSLETTTSQLNEIENKQTQGAYKVSKEFKQKYTPKTRKTCKNCGNNWHIEGKDRCPEFKQKYTPKTRKTCKNCGNNWHIEGKDRCPVKNVKCHKCSKVRHFAKVCLSSKFLNQNRYDKKVKVNFTKHNSDDSSDSSFCLTNKLVRNMPVVTIKVNEVPLEFIIDTGSSVNVISYETFKKLPNINVNNTVTPIYSYNSKSSLAPVVVVPKSQNKEEIRICVDMRAANKAIKRTRNIAPTTDDIIAQLNGSTVFSKIDVT
ncbi:hypothetical protein QE152_g8714 [Popillia japonica]|uniref:Uncharacterized protein n=1 Tax=Popillia japonica TaxID=7064 RepID=A0AAW1LX11_POPJA